MSTNPTNEHREQARELLPCPFCGGKAILGMFNVWCAKCRAQTDKDVDAEAPELILRWNRRALSSRDTEIREVLEGLRNDGGCWCPYVDDTGKCGSGCDAARALYAKLQPGK